MRAGAQRNRGVKRRERRRARRREGGKGDCGKKGYPADPLRLDT